MSGKRKKVKVRPIYSFLITWLIMALLLPLYRVWALLLAIILSLSAAYLSGRKSVLREQEKEKEAQAAQPAEVPKKSYGPKIDPIIEEGNKALSEMGRLYMSIGSPEIRQKINELMRITDKIVQDAVEDPDDIPQIRKFMNYYLPTTIKLLHAYDRMDTQGIEGENLNKSKNSINEMLDTAIAAYKKRLDSLFENQALDIETDIQVMNTMLAREGLSGEKDFVTEPYERKDDT